MGIGISRELLPALDANLPSVPAFSLRSLTARVDEGKHLIKLIVPIEASRLSWFHQALSSNGMLAMTIDDGLIEAAR
jgi:hypothetical protein